jgi:hypothetical protein
MQESSSNNNESLSNNQILSSRKHALVLVIMMPLILAGLGILVFVMWQISIKWTTTSDLTIKILLSIGGLFMLILEMFLAHLIRKLIKWASEGISTRHQDNIGH